MEARQSIPGKHLTIWQHAGRIILGLFMLLAGIAHLTFQRIEFQAQVPDWVPFDKNTIVILSGIVELFFGIAMLCWKKERVRVGLLLSIFYVLVFPGNIAQYMNHTDAFHLDSDRARLIRLFFQPVLVIWSLWSTGALQYLAGKTRSNK